MIIGYNTIMGDVLDTPQIPVQNINYLQFSNCIIDEFHVRSEIIDAITKEEFDDATILKGTFSGDLEAGSISMRGNKIAKYRAKRREIGHTTFRTVYEKEFDDDEQNVTETIEFKDYEPRSNVEYEWQVVPVDESGIEGSVSSVTHKVEFDGWWIIDQDNPDEYNLQFVFNMDSVNIGLEEDRTVLSTFARFPRVYYGAKHIRTITLKGLWSQDKYNTSPIWKQIEKLDTMRLMRKSFLVKSGNGRRFIADIHSPSESTYEGISQIEDVQVSVYEVGELVD